MSVVAHAHPNIALIKYWGKSAQPGNIPAVPSLSVTLDTLTTTTRVTEADADAFYLNDQPVADRKVAGCLANLRSRYPIPPLAVHSSNNFPTAAGLASSASGFAALVTAVDAYCQLELTPAQRSDLARQASASAARSVFGGFVTLAGPDWQGRPLLDADDWPLAVVIAVTDTASKTTSSTQGMTLSAASPYFRGWVESTHDDFATALGAIERRDFATLAELAEHSCLKLHGLMMATRPPLLYWNPTTLACLQRVRALRQQGADVFFTIDAGPQVKAICLPGSRDDVVRALSAIPGVARVVSAGLGPGAWLA